MNDLEKVANAILASSFDGNLSEVQITLNEGDYYVINGIYEQLKRIADALTKEEG